MNRFCASLSRSLLKKSNFASDGRNLHVFFALWEFLNLAWVTCPHASARLSPEKVTWSYFAGRKTLNYVRSYQQQFFIDGQGQAQHKKDVHRAFLRFEDENLVCVFLVQMFVSVLGRRRLARIQMKLSAVDVTVKCRHWQRERPIVTRATPETPERSAGTAVNGNRLNYNANAILVFRFEAHKTNKKWIIAPNVRKRNHNASARVRFFFVSLFNFISLSSWR